jgi:hypothetical protein
VDIRARLDEPTGTRIPTSWSSNCSQSLSRLPSSEELPLLSRVDEERRIGKETLQWQKRNISRNCGCANSFQKCGERKLNEKWTAGYYVKRKSEINISRGGLL